MLPVASGLAAWQQVRGARCCIHVGLATVASRIKKKKSGVLQTGVETRAGPPRRAAGPLGLGLPGGRLGHSGCQLLSRMWSSRNWAWEWSKALSPGAPVGMGCARPSLAPSECPSGLSPQVGHPQCLLDSVLWPRVSPATSSHMGATRPSNVLLPAVLGVQDTALERE